MTNVNVRRVEFDIGETIFEQKLRLVGERKSDGTYSWNLIQDALSQRDEACMVAGIPTQVLERLGDVALKLKQGDIR